MLFSDSFYSRSVLFGCIWRTSNISACCSFNEQNFEFSSKRLTFHAIFVWSKQCSSSGWGKSASYIHKKCISSWYSSVNPWTDWWTKPLQTPTDMWFLFSVALWSNSVKCFCSFYLLSSVFFLITAVKKSKTELWQHQLANKVVGTFT